MRMHLEPGTLRTVFPETYLTGGCVHGGGEHVVRRDLWLLRLRMKSTPRFPTVLVVDDDPDCQFFTRRLLVKAGIKNPIVVLDSGEAAINYLRAACPAAGGRRSRKPALALVDVNMPKVDGFKVVRWARKKKALRKMKIFMLSSSDLASDRQRAAELGADGYLVKYPAPATLLNVLRSSLVVGVSH